LENLRDGISFVSASNSGWVILGGAAAYLGTASETLGMGWLGIGWLWIGWLAGGG
jgi:hypothetical protein